MIKSKIEYALKHYAFLQFMYKLTMSNVFRTVGLFIKTDPNLVLYSSMAGRANYDSPQALCDYLKAHKEFAHLHHVWAFTNPEKVEGYEGCDKIKIDSLKYFLTALKARYWITNVNIERGLKFKKHNTRYLNTWHGVAFNCIGNDVPGRSDYDSRNVNYICYESEYSKAILMRALGAPEHVMIPTGLPRNDELYHVSKDEVARIKKHFGIPDNKKVILYAPTWRDSNDGGKTYSIAPPIDFKKWEKELGSDYVVLLRTHHFTTKQMDVHFNQFLINATDYPRINDIFKITDILVSDYSACMSDFSILERPFICFAYDIDQYSKSRGLYIDFEKEMPSGVFKDEDAVISHIKSMNYDAECKKSRDFKLKYTNFGGHATETCVEKLFSL